MTQFTDTEPSEEQLRIFRLLDLVEPLQRAVAAKDHHEVEYLVRDLNTYDISFLLVRAFHHPGPGRPPGRDPSDRAYYLSKLKRFHRQLKKQWCRDNDRQRITGAANKTTIAKQAIVRYEAMYPQMRAWHFKVNDLDRDLP